MLVYGYRIRELCELFLNSMWKVNETIQTGMIYFLQKVNAMKYLKQFLIILSLSFLGELLHALIPLPIPSSIYGLLILFLLLSTKVFHLEDVRETSEFLIAIMPVMFIPAGVRLMTSGTELSPILLPAIVIVIVTTVLVFFVSGKTAVYMRKGGKRYE